MNQWGAHAAYADLEPVENPWSLLIHFCNQRETMGESMLPTGAPKELGRGLGCTRHGEEGTSAGFLGVSLISWGIKEIV